MRWLLPLARLPRRVVIAYLRELRVMRELRAQGRCAICGVPADGHRYCPKHQLEEMAAP